MDDFTPLHPNLAATAAAYRRLHHEWASGQITHTEARARIAALVARDDQGVQWRIDPGTGQWQRQLRDMRWETAEPPTYGVQTLTAADVSQLTDRADVDQDGYASFEVDEDKLLPPRSVFGSTRKIARAQADDGVEETPSRSSAGRYVAIVAGVAAAAVAAWQTGLVG